MTADMRLADVCRALNIHHNTASKWARRGLLPGAYRIGARGDWRVPASTIEDIRSGALNPDGDAELERVKAALREYRATWHASQGHEYPLENCRWSTCLAIAEALESGDYAALVAAGGPSPDAEAIS